MLSLAKVIFNGKQKDNGENADLTPVGCVVRVIGCHFVPGPQCRLDLLIALREDMQKRRAEKQTSCKAADENIDAFVCEKLLIAVG